MATAALALAGPIIQGLAGFFGSKSASQKAATGYNNAMQGVLGAADNTVTSTLSAGTSAQDKVNAATNTANATLRDGLSPQTDNLKPYLAGGEQGVTGLMEYLKSNPQFGFNPTDLENEPGYKFQLGQGTEAINNSASSRGLLQSGNTLKALTQYGQGLAGTYYQQAFDRALNTFKTNRDTTFAGSGMLMDAGLAGSKMFNQATQNTTDQVAKNELGAGYFGGGTDIDLAKYLGNVNNRAAEVAGDYAVGAGGARAAGTMGAYNSIGGGGNSIANIISQILSKRGGGGSRGVD